MTKGALCVGLAGFALGCHTTAPGSVDSGDVADLAGMAAPKDMAMAAPSCTDKMKNGSESDVDCGGGCGSCGDGKGCGMDSDCASMVCKAGMCAMATCVDGKKNGDESDIDCGGSCGSCGDGKACGKPGDCASGVCQGGVCVAPSCVDMVKNGGESDVDCGGPCAGCGDGKPCGKPADCASGVCTAGVCAKATCIDLVKNGGESDVDCGGPCPVCGDGKICGGGQDCASKVCSNGVCVMGSCADKIKNGNETDVDCGGSCGPCGDGKMCGKPAECASKVCKNGVCAQATCNDMVKNGAESDVDCGGGMCARCGIGLACGGMGDCLGSICENLKCRAAVSCKELHAMQGGFGDGAYPIDPDGALGMQAQFQAWCDMTVAGGGWTLIMKSAANNDTFNYDSAYWTDANLLNPNDVTINSGTSKYPSYLAFSSREYMLNLAANRASRSMYTHPQPIAARTLFGLTNNVTDPDNAALNLGQWTPTGQCTMTPVPGPVAGIVWDFVYGRFIANRWTTGGVGYSAVGLGMKSAWMNGGPCNGSWGSKDFVLLWIR